MAELAEVQVITNKLGSSKPIIELLAVVGGGKLQI
jgi:hypothetical protein